MLLEICFRHNLIVIQNQRSQVQVLLHKMDKLNLQVQTHKKHNQKHQRYRMQKVSQLIQTQQAFNSKSYNDLSPVLKEAINDTMKLVKSDGNLLFNFENAINKVAEFHNVNKDDIEEYFDNELKEQVGE
ncbi:MAG: hypothetical protein CBD14_08390 [Proteobacteria bacterium TMED154]|nr:MAG: hypothetical protein CBD14_08390 [Proteobacteria bacterium TMED154]